MEVKDISTAPGHWILAKMGKKVLRPGGKELTEKLVEHLEIEANDDVIEFAPGLGFTANLSLKKHPHSYIGVDADPEAIAYLQNKIKGNNLSFVNGNAQEGNLKECCATKLYGEARLTMHADDRRANIIKEAHGLLKAGGLYAIHEIGLTPNTNSDELKSEIQKNLNTTIRVNAPPTTEDEWSKLLTDAGFEIVYQTSNGMHLLESKRIISDEGFFNTLKLGWNIMSHKGARKRILAMRKIFRKHESHMNAVVMVARKV